MPKISPPPDNIDLGRLFHRWPEFESLKDWKKAGFQTLRAKEGKILVLSHKGADRYLFKKYGSSSQRSAKEQLKNYQNRIAGALLLRKHINDNDLRRVVVPQKWLCELPTESGSRGKSPHVLVVERHRILDAEESQKRYRHLDAETAREMCTILFAFRGLDLTEFTSRNAPFTRDGKIAFIDTEYINPSSKKLRSRIKYYDKYLDIMLSKHRRLAEDVWKELVKTTVLK